MTTWVLDWSAWEAQESRLAALRAALADEQLAAARVRASIAVVNVLHGARPRVIEADVPACECPSCRCVEYGGPR